ncbi:MAG: aminotransferase class V-fold PLP-dependent enzyme [Alphaproteobacteria bacterium]|nr:aminotransferase class V-fold PLP-dependent enzyme [Alphaproteobacteria bacterium]MCB9699486.1 aminotransferase class V-fold PLP-dependent enzyme [Alphaproteobacteria bacterium]
MWGAVTRTYLDHAATSPLLPEVDAAMAPWRGRPGNPSSVHQEGRRAADALEAARADVARLLGRPDAGIVFCSGATEANHTAVRGLVAQGHQRIAAAGIEHPSVHEALRMAGAEVVALRVGADGVIRISEVGATALVCMAVNHETGVIQPVEQAFATGLPVHVDATAAAGRIPLALAEATSVALTAHKLGGPVGIGALSLRDGGAFPALVGGAQERGRRGGTTDVIGAIGFAAACALALRRVEELGAERARLDEHLRRGLRALGAEPVGAWERTAPGTTCATFPGLLGETVVQAMDLAGFAISSGAACASGSVGPSPVLAAMGHPEPRAGVRVSLGPSTTVGEVDAFLAALGAFLARARPDAYSS